MAKEMKALSPPMEKALFHIFPETAKDVGLCKEKCPMMFDLVEKLGVYGLQL
jgi:hypothetical protein